MASNQDILIRTMGFLERNRSLVLPVTAAILIMVILVPLPPMLMDVLLVTNIALAFVILMTTIRISSPLEFSVFPSVLLGTTLLRLVLNVATTRLILTSGEGGRSLFEAQKAAGHVIWAFSEFVASGQLAVGAIIFAIIVVIQFVVITKGAGRISEVAARFVLDAMPGKQMAIDADLNAGLIKDEEARTRRQKITQEADFYGAMDGASKFLRGDAIAAVVITLVNILGGLYVGMMQYGWDFSQTVDLFTRLTIGDGLVTQIPAFITSVSAALIVTRSNDKTNLGDEVVTQLASRPVVLLITGIFLAALTLTSLPKIPLLLLGIGCVGLAWILQRKQEQDNAEIEKADQANKPQGSKTQNVEQLLTVDPMGVDMGYSLVRLVDPSMGGELLERIASLRKQIALELGLLVPPISIRDNMKLEAHAYQIKIRGTKIAAGKIYPSKLLAIAGSNSKGELIGRDTFEPAFGTAAVWISPDQKSQAQQMNYAVVEPSGVLITHLCEAIYRHGSDLLTREQIKKLLDNLSCSAPNLVREVTEKVELGRIQKLLQNLVSERVSIRDLETILEAIGEVSSRDETLENLTEKVRASLSRSLSQQYCDSQGKLWCVCSDQELENQLIAHMDRAEGSIAVISPELCQNVFESFSEDLNRLRQLGRNPVVVCSPTVRSILRKLISPKIPDVAVLGYNEIESVEIESLNTVGVE